VESMDFSLATHRLVSVGDGRHSIKLWNVDENGNLVVSDIPARLTSDFQECLALTRQASSCRNILSPVLLGSLTMELRLSWGIWSKRLCESSRITAIYVS
jgi:hypothetical protein